MTRMMISAALLAALSLATPAFAADTPTAPNGHWEWQSVPQYGPRSTPAQKRVWVPDAAQMANCDCDMMKVSATECMKSMHDGHAAPSAS